jgi:hypothetical protein
MMDVEIEGIAVDVILADELRFVGLIDGALERLALGNVFTADVDVGRVGSHREGRDEASFDQEMRIVPHDLPVLAGARLGLVGIHHEVMRPTIRLLRHEGPLEACREAGAASPAQA